MRDGSAAATRPRHLSGMAKITRSRVRIRACRDRRPTDRVDEPVVIAV